jgi:hypothetical protein
MLFRSGVEWFVIFVSLGGLRQGRPLSYPAWPVMSPVGTKRTSRPSLPTSVLGGKADLMFGYGRLGLNGIPGLRRLVDKAGIRLRSSSPDYADVHGEGWIPAPLPPPAVSRPRILQVNSRAIKPSNTSNFSSESPDSRSSEPADCSPKAPSLSEALDSIHSVRFWKFERLKLLLNFGGKRFCGSSRKGESSDFQFAISRFESSAPARQSRAQQKCS